MSEQNDHLEPGDNRRVGPSPWFGLILFTALAALLIAISIGLRLAVSPRPQRIDDLTVKPVPDAELRNIAVAEVKRRQGWSGKAAGPYSGLFTRCTVAVEGDADNAKGLRVDVVLDGFTGAVLDYRKLEPNAAEAAQSWKKLLGAMAARDEKRMRQLATRAGFESLEKAVAGDDRMHVFERLGKGWQEWETRWQHSTAPDRVECRMGPKAKEHLLVFKNTAEGWKLDEWSPGE